MLTIFINTRKLPFKIVHLRSPQKNTSNRIDAKVEIYDCAINRWVSEIGIYEKDNSNLLDCLKSSIKTQNKTFNKLIQDIEHIATHSTAPILFSGPTGSGKSKLARKIYELRLKLNLISGAFVEINCATLRGESALSTLFGHVKGAFTGAVTARKGLLKMANNGLLFLDEIAELSLDMQALLLKAIEEHRFIPFGADEEVNSNFQLICATNKNLKQAVIQGSFRPDLLSRINLWHFHLPSLRERPEDIEPNIDYELQRFTAEKGIFAEFVPAAKKTYLQFATSSEAIWPNNFRSLLGSLERMITYSFRGVIDDSVVNQEISLLKNLWKEDSQITAVPASNYFSEFYLLKQLIPELADKLDLFDKIQLEATLYVCLTSANRSEAGRKLFADSRTKKKSLDDTVRINKYLKSYGLTWDFIYQECREKNISAYHIYNTQLSGMD
jgi:transcriptional regulatory protein RtcR